MRPRPHANWTANGQRCRQRVARRGPRHRESESVRRATQRVAERLHHPRVPTREHVLHFIGEQLTRLEALPLDPLARVDEVLDVTERCTRAVHDYARSREDPLEHVSSSLHAALQAIAAGATETFIPTGLTRIDELIRGLVPGELTVVAAHPGMGRTSFALAVAQRVAQSGAGVLLAALELEPENVARRLIAMASRLRWDQLTAPMLDPTIEEAAAELGSLPLFVMGRRALTARQLGTHARARALDPHAPPVQLVIVDRVQLLRADPDGDAGGDSKRVWSELRELARSLNVAVLVTTELRPSASRWPRRPTMVDLPRGVLENGDLILTLDRVEVVRRIRGLTVTTRMRHRCDVTVMRRRHGVTGKTTLLFDEESGTFLGR